MTENDNDKPDKPEPNGTPDKPEPPDKPKPPEPPDKPEPPKGFHIRIDRTDYVVEQEKLNGEQLRHVPETPIPPDRDIYQVVPGHDDLKIKDDDTVPMHDGLRFYTVPSTINPGLASVSGRSE